MQYEVEASTAMHGVAAAAANSAEKETEAPARASVCRMHIFEYGSAMRLPTSAARQRAKGSSCRPHAHCPALAPRGTTQSGRVAHASQSVRASRTSSSESTKAQACAGASHSHVL